MHAHPLRIYGAVSTDFKKLSHSDEYGHAMLRREQAAAETNSLASVSDSGPKCNSTSPCPAPDQCHTNGTCTLANGTCSYPRKANFTLCNDGNKCTRTDTCQAGTCKGANPVVCPPPDQCHNGPGTCNPLTGLCTYPKKADGTPCNDGNQCTRIDTCQAGTCKGANPVVCPPPDQCQNGPGTCNPLTGLCTFPKKADGTPCNDGNRCTRTDTCQGGTCKGGNPVVCPAPPDAQCQNPGVCNRNTGLCSDPRNKANGTPCNDGNRCTRTDTCRAGICRGANPVVCPAPLGQCQMGPGTCSPFTGICTYPNKADGTPCNDGNRCTRTDTCQGGTCRGGNPVVCPAPPDAQCQIPGVCNRNTGLCSDPRNKANGTPCNDNDPCTQTDKCQEGTCTGTSPKRCLTPKLPCEKLPGTCKPETGDCEYTPNNGVPCNDRKECTKDDTCQDRLCKGTLHCPAPDDCHVDGTCDPVSGQCVFLEFPDGSICDDHKDCTTDDKCTKGVCAGTALPDGSICDDHKDCTTDDKCTKGVCAGTVDCPPLVCHAPGQCDPFTGGCIYPDFSVTDTTATILACTSPPSTSPVLSPMPESIPSPAPSPSPTIVV